LGTLLRGAPPEPQVDLMALRNELVGIMHLLQPQA